MGEGSTKRGFFSRLVLHPGQEDAAEGDVLRPRAPLLFLLFFSKTKSKIKGTIKGDPKLS